MPFRARRFRDAVDQIDPDRAFTMGRQLVLSRLPFDRSETLALLERGTKSTTPATATTARFYADAVANGFTMKTYIVPIVAGDDLTLRRLEEDALADPHVRDAADRFDESA